MRFTKPNIVVSKCLEFDKCRWNGEMIRSDIVSTLKGFVNFIPVCPEVEIGLGVPRPSVRIQIIKGKNRLFQPETNKDLTFKMNKFSDEFLGSLKDIDGFILKYRSPSCGINNVRVWPESEKGSWRNVSAGFFGRKVMSLYENLPVEDEGRLLNFKIRHHFFTKVFLLADLRTKPLKGFHEENRLLYDLYDKKITVKLESCLDDKVKYRTVIEKSFNKFPSCNSSLNMFDEISKRYLPNINSNENKLYNKLKKDYKNGKIHYQTLLNLIKSWSLRFDDSDIYNQRLFNLYPDGIFNFSDSGRQQDLCEIK